MLPWQILEVTWVNANKKCPIFSSDLYSAKIMLKVTHDAPDCIGYEVVPMLRLMRSERLCETLLIRELFKCHGILRGQILPVGHLWEANWAVWNFKPLSIRIHSWDSNRVASPPRSQSGSCALINNYFNIIDSLPLTSLMNPCEYWYDMWIIDDSLIRGTFLSRVFLYIYYHIVVSYIWF